MEKVRVNEEGDILVEYEHEAEALDAIIKNFHDYINESQDAQNTQELQEAILELHRAKKAVIKCMSGALRV